MFGRRRCYLLVLVILLGLSFVVPSSWAKGYTSVVLRKSKPTFSLHPPTTSLTRGRVGNAIPMNGGYLTLGAYFVDITIGRPPQTLSVLVDTGSSNTAVPVKACTACGQGPFYNPSQSITAVPLSCSSDLCQKCVPEGYVSNRCLFGQPYCADDALCGYGITYGGGSSGLYGSYVLDEVCIGGQCGVVALGMIREQYNFQSNFNSTSQFFGILGLAYPWNACNPSCTTPIYEDIAKQSVSPNIVSMCLTPSSGGVLDLGFIDHTKYVGNLQWVPVIDKKWYNIQLKDILVGNYSLGFREFMYVTTNDVIGAFVDSGTSVIITGPAAFSAIQNIFQTNYSFLPGIKNLFPPGSGCVSKQIINPVITKFPTLSFVIGAGAGNPDVVLHTPPKQYLMDTGNTYCLGIAGFAGVGVVLGDMSSQID